MLLFFDDYEKQSRKLAAVLDLPCHKIQRHRFPDGEYKCTLPAKLPEHVLFCQSLDQPNEKLLALLLAAKTARELGAKVLTLVAPYLCYMRQDKAFNAGEVISKSIVGNFLADLFDNVITVDPHLHRIQHLEQAVPAKHAVALSATSLNREFVNRGAFAVPIFGRREDKPITHNRQGDNLVTAWELDTTHTGCAAAHWSHIGLAEANRLTMTRYQ